MRHTCLLPRLPNKVIDPDSVSPYVPVRVFWLRQSALVRMFIADHLRMVANISGPRF